MSRPRKMLPVLGHTPAPEQETPGSTRAETGPCADDCCAEAEASPTTREANPEVLGGDFVGGGFERTVVRVEGMDCASCAATVEKRVFALPGVRRATVNFAAGRLDAEHAPGLPAEEIEKAVEGAGYRVVRKDAAGGPDRRVGAALSRRARVVVGGGAGDVRGRGVRAGDRGRGPAHLPGGGGRAAVADAGHERPDGRRHDRGGREWAEAASVVVLFSAGNALQAYAVDRTRGAVRSLARLVPDEVLVRRGHEELVVAADEVGVGEMVVVRQGARPHPAWRVGTTS